VKLIFLQQLIFYQPFHTYGNIAISTMVEYSPQHPKVKGSSPAPWREEIEGKISSVKGFY
jgi:hypothetical protein